jgi:hypothetical protein
MKVKPLSQQDWDQLLVIASGYLTLTGGNLDQAMARAIEAHARLIDSVKKGRITTRLGRGTVRLVVPEEGGLALAFEGQERAPTPAPPPPRGSVPAPVAARPDLSGIAPPPPLEPTPPLLRPVPPAEELPAFPDVSFEVFERPSSHQKDQKKREDAGIMDE